jgi:hypothetical protein
MMSFIPIMLFKEKTSCGALLVSCSMDTWLCFSKGHAADQSLSLGVEVKSVRSYNSPVCFHGVVN